MREDDDLKRATELSLQGVFELFLAEKCKVTDIGLNSHVYSILTLKITVCLCRI